LTRGAEDVEAWLTAWLRSDPPPPAHLPAQEQIGPLIRAGGRVSFDPLMDKLQARERGEQ